ncbi:MAG: inositol monophosphatase, partial [Deltaproteobacteria bacterium]|nr:inositol monophosphatase [Deltaproteobacteria bacterium]
KAQGIRRAGAAAIDLCYVAAGRLDGFWEQGLKPWDTAAGSLILQEAGGQAGDFSGGPYSPYQETIIAGNPSVYRAMLEVIEYSSPGG